MITDVKESARVIRVGADWLLENIEEREGTRPDDSRVVAIVKAAAWHLYKSNVI